MDQIYRSQEPLKSKKLWTSQVFHRGLVSCTAMQTKKENTSSLGSTFCFPQNTMPHTFCFCQITMPHNCVFPRSPYLAVFCFPQITIPLGFLLFPDHRASQLYFSQITMPDNFLLFPDHQTSQLSAFPRSPWWGTWRTVARSTRWHACWLCTEWTCATWLPPSCKCRRTSRSTCVPVTFLRWGLRVLCCCLHPSEVSVCCSFFKLCKLSFV